MDRLVPSASYELRVTSYKLRVTSYELQATSYKLQVTSYELQADQLLEMGFRPDVLKILSALEPTASTRQTLSFFSAGSL